MAQVPTPQKSKKGMVINMKKILSVFFLLVITLCTILLCGCTEKEQREVLMLQPTYVGKTITDTDYTFKKDDFKLVALYAGNVSEEVTDFAFEVVELKGGYFTVLFTWNDQEEELLVSITLDIYE